MLCITRGDQCCGVCVRSFTGNQGLLSYCCCVLIYCCDLKDAVRSISSPTVLSEVRRLIEVPKDVMEEIEVSTML